MKIGRNDLCNCGSGMKYKKCCLNKSNVYLLKVKYLYDNFECTIRLTDNETLFDLHGYIQAATDWDNDHMFAFYMNNKFWDSKFEYSGNPIGEGTADILLRDLPLSQSQKFAYVFDFGDEHRFEIEIVSINKQSTDGTSDNSTKIGIIEKKGSAPDQYGCGEDKDMDDEDDNDKGDDEIEIKENNLIADSQQYQQEHQQQNSR